MVKKKRKSRLIVFLALLLFVIIILAIVVFTNLGMQPAQAAVPGVAEGDFFTYEVMGIVNSKSSDAEIPSEFINLNNTEWYRVTVTDVSGPEVSIETAQHFKNGTEVTGIGMVNVETGIASPINGFWAIFASDLKENDRVHPISPDWSTVNQTITRNYGAGGIRETNALTLINTYVDQDDSSITYTEYGNTYFDRQTGMLVELRYISIYNKPEVTLQLLWKITDTNRWAIS